MKWSVFKKDESGASAVVVALLFTVILLGAALVVDIGVAYSKGVKLQNTCDSASLAAARELPDIAKATATAKQYIEDNGIDSTKARIEFLDCNTKVKVTIMEDVRTAFARVIGINNLDVGKAATASKSSLPVTTTNKRIGAIFNYLLFQGSTNDMTFNSGDIGIHGMVHSNGNIKVNAALLAIGGFSDVGGELYATSSFPVVKRNEATDEFETVGKANIQWSPYKIQILMNDGSVIDDITNSEYFIHEEKEIPMPAYVDQNIEDLIPDSRPTITDFSGFKAYSGTLNSCPTDANIHYTGKSGTLEKSLNHHLYTDGNLKVSARTSDVTINGNIYCDGDLTLWAYGGKITINGNLYVNGGLKFETNGDVTVNGNIYCNGNISSSGDSIGRIDSTYVYCQNFTPGGRTVIYGTLVAEKNIQFTSGGNDVTGSLAVVSKNGNVNLNAATQEFNGIIYAPKGKVTLAGDTNMHGNIIAQNLGLSSHINLYPLKQSTIDDLYDSVLKDESQTETVMNDVIKLVE